MSGRSYGIALVLVAVTLCVGFVWWKRVQREHERAVVTAFLVVATAWRAP